MSDLYNTARLPILWCTEKFQAWAPGYTLMKVFSSQSVGALALAAQAVNAVEATSGFDVLKYIDPLIGTSNGGKNHKEVSGFVYTTHWVFRSCVCWSNSAIW
jgi:hypothetical protein